MEKYVYSYSVQKKFRSAFTERILESLPNFKGAWLLYSPLLSLIPQQKRFVDMVFSTVASSLFSVSLDIADSAQRTVVKTHFEPGTALTIWSLLGEGDTFIDVGANFGLFSRIASERVGSTGTIISIEPNPIAFRFLREGARENMQLLNVVASRTAELSFTLHKPFYRQTTAGRFLPDANGVVKSMRIDDLYAQSGLKKVTVMKIDTEGAEFLVLEGARKLLEEQHPFVIAEVVPAYAKHFDYDVQELYDYMKGLGYAFYYRINDDEATLEEFEMKGNEEGQILFSPRTLTTEDFNEIIIRENK